MCQGEDVGMVEGERGVDEVSKASGGEGMADGESSA